jgi:hypothetical protein
MGASGFAGRVGIAELTDTLLKSRGARHLAPSAYREQTRSPGLSVRHRHDCRWIPTFVARISQTARLAGITFLLNKQNRCRFNVSLFPHAVDESLQPYNQRKQSLASENLSGVKEKKHEKDNATVTHLSARPRRVRL